MSISIKPILLGISILLLTFILMTSLQQPLTNSDIVWLELSFNETNFNQLMQKIGQDGLEKFSTHVYFDFLLMISYVFLIIQCLRYIGKKNNLETIRKYIVLIILAGLLDGIEDVLMVQKIVHNNLNIHPYHWSYFSTIKFILISICVGFILWQWHKTDYKKRII